MCRTRFVFAVFLFTAVLICTIYIRSANDRLFYQLCVINARQNRLKQELWQRQLQLESLINPAAIARKIGNDGSSHGGGSQ